MTQRPHPGSDRALAGSVMQFSLFEEIERLKAEPDWTAGRRSITLAKQTGLRVVLMVLRAGATVDEHLTAGALTVQVLEGQVRLSAGGVARTLGPGNLLTLEPGLPHDVHAVDASALLLTLGQAVGP